MSNPITEEDLNDIEKSFGNRKVIFFLKIAFLFYFTVFILWYFFCPTY